MENSETQEVENSQKNGLENADWKTIWKMFWAFFRIGAFTIGGGYAMLPLIEKEVTETNKWITKEEMVDIFAVVQSVPGVIAINTSMFVGYKIGKMKGAVIAALGVTLPSFITILAIAYLMFNIQDNIYIQRAFTGVRAGVTALIGLSAWKLCKSILTSKVSLALGIAGFLALVVFDINAVFIIIGGGIAGYLIYGLRQVKKS